MVREMCSWPDSSENAGGDICDTGSDGLVQSSGSPFTGNLAHLQQVNRLTAKKKAPCLEWERSRAPDFEHTSMVRILNYRLRTGAATSPESDRLPLLPSDPGGVHGLSPCGTRPSMLLELAVATNNALCQEFDPPGGDLRWIRDPEPPI